MSSKDVASSILALPLEILEHFVETSPVSTWLSLSLVSQLFYQLSIRSLYRDIALKTPTAVITCCRTIAARPKAAAAVRSFSITYNPTELTYLLSFYNLLFRAFDSLTELKDLNILVEDPHYIQILNHCTFPRLRHFECQLLLTTPLVNFLNRHKTISYVQTSPFENLSSSKDAPPEIDLPALEYFSGNAESVVILSSVVSLRAAFVSWGAIDHSPEIAIKQLEHYSENSLRVLSCRRRGWNLDLLDVVSSRLPGVFALNLANLLIVDSSPTQAYLDAVKGYLSRFKQLQRLIINCVDVWQMGNVACKMDKDFATVTAWGEVCPSLVEIILPHSDMLSWYRVAENMWLPDPKDHSGAVWLYEAVRTQKYPGWNRVIDLMQEKISLSVLNPCHFDDSIALVRSLAKGGVGGSGDVGAHKVCRWFIADDDDEDGGSDSDSDGEVLEITSKVSEDTNHRREWRNGRGHQCFVEL